MTLPADTKVLNLLVPPKTSLGGRRIEAFLKETLAISVETIEAPRGTLQLVVTSTDLPSIRDGETLILRGYPKPTDPRPNRVLAQNFLHFFPWVGLNLSSLKNLVLTANWLIFGGRVRGIVFQTQAGLERATRSLVGRLIMALYRPEVSVENFYRPDPIPFRRSVSADLLIITSTLPHKCPRYAVTLARRLIAQIPSARVVITLPVPSDHEPHQERRIEYLGEVPEARVRELISSSAIVAIPSRTESFSLPLHDCLFAGVPVVCFDTIQPDLETPLLHVVAFGDIEGALTVVRGHLGATGIRS